MVRKSGLFAPLCGSLAFAGAFLALAACGSDSSTSSKGEAANVFDSEDDLPECSDSLGLDSAYVGADSALYVCADGKWQAADSSDVEKSSSSEAGNSSGSKGSSSSAGGSSSSAESSSSSAGTSSSSDAPGTETLYVCEDRVNDISLKLYNDTLIFRHLMQVYGGTYISADKAEEQDSLTAGLAELAYMASAYKLLPMDKLCKLSPAQCALAAVDPDWEIVIDSSLRTGVSYRLPDTEKNRELVLSYRIEIADLASAADFDNSDCVGGDVSYCRSGSRSMGIIYKYPEDTLVIGSWVRRLDFPYEGFVSAYGEYFSSLIWDIEEAAAQGNVETLASLMGVEKDSPWLNLFKNGVRISTSFDAGSNYTELDVEMAVKGYDRKELAETVLRAECASSEDFWLKRLIDGKLFADARDNQVYGMVQIGEQTWMAENLNYEYSEGTAQSYCYSDDPTTCKTYGRLYTWSAAMDSAAKFSETGKNCGDGVTCSASEAVRGVCPEGWHLPSDEEWDALKTHVANSLFAGATDSVGYALKSTSGWKSGNGSDAFGFGALPAGIRNGVGNFLDVFNTANFWSTLASGANYAYSRAVYVGSSNMSTNMAPKKMSYSVRCVKD